MGIGELLPQWYWGTNHPKNPGLKQLFSSGSARQPGRFCCCLLVCSHACRSWGRGGRLTEAVWSPWLHAAGLLGAILLQVSLIPLLAPLTNRQWQSTRGHTWAPEHSSCVTAADIHLTKENFMAKPKSRGGEMCFFFGERNCKVTCQRTWTRVWMHLCVCVCVRKRERRRRETDRLGLVIQFTAPFSDISHQLPPQVQCSSCLGPSLFLEHKKFLPTLGLFVLHYYCTINLLGALALKFAFQRIPATWQLCLFFNFLGLNFILFLMIYTLRAFIDLRIDLKAFQIHHRIIATLLYPSNTVKPAKRWETN